MVYVIFLSWHPEVDVISHVHRRTCVRWGRTSRHLSWPFRVGDRVPARAGTEIKLRDFSGLFVLRDRGTLVRSSFLAGSEFLLDNLGLLSGTRQLKLLFLTWAGGPGRRRPGPTPEFRRRPPGPSPRRKVLRGNRLAPPHLLQKTRS
ncbi:probable G-protein coupled receptor 160 isoform X3 [Panthera tigris]|nr:probable G-protein coupled receptor 160 isoform X3 [Panthera tigris]